MDDSFLFHLSFNICRSRANGVVQQYPAFLAPETSFVEDSFSRGRGRGWFGDDAGALHLFDTLSPLLLHQLPHRSSGRRPQRLGTPGWEEAGMNVITDTTGTFYQTMSQTEN